MNVLVKSVSFYLERFHRYGVLKKYNFFGPPVTWLERPINTLAHTPQ